MQFRVTRRTPDTKYDTGDMVMFRVEAENSAQAGRIGDELVYAVACYRGIYPDTHHASGAADWAQRATNEAGQIKEVV